MEVAALHVDGVGGLAHIPAELPEFLRDELALEIGTGVPERRGARTDGQSRVLLLRRRRRAADRRRDVPRRQNGTGGHDDQPLDEVPQLAYIARPGVSDKERKRLLV